MGYAVICNPIFELQSQLHIQWQSLSGNA